VILTVFVNVINGTEVVGEHFSTLLYHGTSLPPGIFDDFLAIPSVVSQLSSLTYLEALDLGDRGEERGSGAEMGASAVSGGVEEYINAYRAWSEFSTDPTVIPSISLAVLALTPISQFQISIGRARGSNIFDPPLVNYAAIDFQATAPPGETKFSPQVEAARQRFFAK
jgi:hypothetical protein